VTTTAPRHSEELEGVWGRRSCWTRAYSSPTRPLYPSATPTSSFRSRSSRSSTGTRAADDVGRAPGRWCGTSNACGRGGRNFREPVPLPTGGTVRVTVNGLVIDRLAALGLDAASADNRILARPRARRARRVPGQGRLADAACGSRPRSSAFRETTPASKGRRRPRRAGWHRVETGKDLIDALYASVRRRPAAFDGWSPTSTSSSRPVRPRRWPGSSRAG